jgi:hypothetical protein
MQLSLYPVKNQPVHYATLNNSIKLYINDPQAMGFYASGHDFINSFVDENSEHVNIKYNDRIKFVENFSSLVTTTGNFFYHFNKSFELVEESNTFLEINSELIDYIEIDNNRYDSANGTILININEWEDNSRKVLKIYTKDRNISFNSSFAENYNPFGEFGNCEYNTLENYGIVIIDNYTKIERDNDYYYEIDLGDELGRNSNFSYNINYLQNKMFKLKSTLDFSSLNFSYSGNVYNNLVLKAKETLLDDMFPLAFSYNNGDNIINAVGMADNPIFVLGNNQIKISNSSNNVLIWDTLYDNSYQGNYGVYPVLVFNSKFNYNNLDFSYVDTSGNPVASSYRFALDFTNFIIENSDYVDFDTYKIAYQTGLSDGYYKALEWRNLIRVLANSLESLLNIELLPNISIKILIFIPIMFSILSFIIKAFIK